MEAFSSLSDSSLKFLQTLRCGLRVAALLTSAGSGGGRFANVDVSLTAPTVLRLALVGREEACSSATRSLIKTDAEDALALDVEAPPYTLPTTSMLSSFIHPGS